MNSIIDYQRESISHFEEEYKCYGVHSQRLYPNEALCRFMGRYFFSLDEKIRKKYSILEVGCGSGGNIWMISKEGFNTFGIDGSEEAIKICKNHLKDKWGVSAELEVARFEDLPYDNNKFDAVVDIVSLQHLNLQESDSALKEIYRVLKPDGLFFSYRLSDGSCMFNNSGGEYVDAATVDNVYDKKMPLNNNKQMSFWSPSLTKMMYEKENFHIESIEKDTRSYNNNSLLVEYLSIIAKK